MSELLSRVEIAALLGITPQRVYQLIRSGGFPRPLATLAIGEVWERSVIEEWAREAGRDLGDPAAISGPAFDVTPVPDLSHRQDGRWAGEVVAVRELRDALAGDAEVFGDLVRAHHPHDPYPRLLD